MYRDLTDIKNYLVSLITRCGDALTLRVTLWTVILNSEVYGFDETIVKSKVWYFGKLKFGSVEPYDIIQSKVHSLVLSNFVSDYWFEIVPTLLLRKVVKTATSYNVFWNGLKLWIHDIIHNGWVVAKMQTYVNKDVQRMKLCVRTRKPFRLSDEHFVVSYPHQVDIRVKGKKGVGVTLWNTGRSRVKL